MKGIRKGTSQILAGRLITRRKWLRDLTFETPYTTVCLMYRIWLNTLIILQEWLPYARSTKLSVHWEWRQVSRWMAAYILLSCGENRSRSDQGEGSRSLFYSGALKGEDGAGTLSTEPKRPRRTCTWCHRETLYSHFLSGRDAVGECFKV